MSNFFGSSSTNNEASQVELGSRLYNLKQSSIGAESVLSILPDNNVVVNTCSSFGKSLLNVSTLNQLIGLINSGDSKVEVIDSTTGEINFTLDNALKLVVKNAYTEVLNELKALNINPLTDLEYSLGGSNKRWNNIYGNKIVDTIATRGWNSSIPFMQNTNSAMNSSQNVLWQHTTNDSTPSNFQLLIETKDVGSIYERMQISSYRNAYRNLHLQPSGKVLIGGDFSSVADSSLGTLNIRGGTTVLNVVGSSYPEIILKDTTNTSDYMSFMRDHSANKNIIRNSGRLDIESPANYTRMTFLGDGKIGINTTSPSTTLDVRGITSIKTSSSSNGALKISVGTGVGGDTNWIGFCGGDGTIADTNDRARIGCQIPQGGSGELYFTAGSNGGTEMMRIKSTGVGIGTNNPQNQLNIEKAYGGVLNEAGSMTLSTISGGIPWGCGAISAYVNAGLNNDNSSFPGGLLFKTKTAGGAGFTLTTRMVIDALGNLGLNNTAPQERLDVSGNVKITGDIVFDADNQRKIASNGSALKEVHCHTAFLKSIEVHSTTAGNIATSAKPFNTLFVSNIGSSGTPVQTLYADVWATSSTTGLRCANNLVLATDLSLPTITWYDVNAKSMILVDTVNTVDGGKLSYDSANSEIVIGTTSPSVERVRIGANGIKTSVNILPADANRNIGSSTAKFNTTYTSTILNPDANLILGRGTTSTVNISASGMSIGSGSNPTEALNVIGNIKVSGNILPNVHNVPKIGTSNSDRFLEGWFGTVYGNGVALTSDRRLKDNIKPITNALETVMKMKPVEYKMKDRVRLHTGFIADEVKNLYNGEDWAVFVEAQDEFKTQSLQYTEIVAVLASALQEVNNRLTKVENRRLVGGSIIDTSSLTEDMTQIYERLDHLSTKYLELENQPVRPTLHKCIEVSRFNEMYDRITNLEARLSAFDEVKDSEESELVHSLMEKNNLLELKINELESKLNNLPKVEAKNEIEDSDTGGLSMIESLQERLFKSEQLIAKQQKMITKLTSAVNKLIKSNE